MWGISGRTGSVQGISGRAIVGGPVGRAEGRAEHRGGRRVRARPGVGGFLVAKRPWERAAGCHPPGVSRGPGSPEATSGRGAGSQAGLGAVTARHRPVPWPGSTANHFQSRCEICCFKRRGGAVSGCAVPAGARGVPAAARPLHRLARALLAPAARSRVLRHEAAFKMGGKKGKKKKNGGGGAKPPRPSLGEFLLPKMAAWRKPSVRASARASARARG